MQDDLFSYRQPDFSIEPFLSAPDARTEAVIKAGVAPDNFHATSIFPEYFKIGGEWVLAEESRMDCVVVIGEGGKPDVREFRRLAAGDLVVTGRMDDGSGGIYVHTGGFAAFGTATESFAFRTNRSRETSYSRDYDRLYEILRYDRDNGYIVWVLGPAVTFDSDSRNAMVSLIENGFVKAVLAGNALATHDLEGSVFKTALGQDIYTQESVPNGHYHHLDILNKTRKAGSIAGLIDGNVVKDGIIHACIGKNVPFVLAGSIRDDGPLPETLADAYRAQDAMRNQVRRATTVICLATQLHSIATGNMTPSYRVVDGKVRPVFIYTVDISEFVVNKLRDRGSLEVTSIVTNIQDFLVNLARNLA
jgi:lysine-ketoglutarate reductase/saccharopine dehydrogenase-like protein (TIGR00300 family)